MSTQLAYRPAPGEIPTQPGVYRFLDASGRVLYVGKAKSLRARLANYFAPLHTLHERTRRMVTSASRVEWTVVGTDVEALQLEYTFIKEFNPPFNVKFRDDKTYPMMAITLAEEAPRVLVTRNRKIRGAKYFGPYPKIWAVHDTIDLLVKVFPIRTCNSADYRRAMQTGKPCFAGQIGKCGGPCSMRVSIDEHRVRVDEFVSFMQSYDRSFIRALDDEMRQASAELRFEDAARARDRKEALEAVLAKSTVLLRDSVDIDVFGIVQDELSAAVQLFQLRGGRIRGTRTFVLDKELDIDPGELVTQLLQGVYGDDLVPPTEVIVPVLPDDRAALEEWLQKLRPRGGRVTVKTAQRGEKAKVAETATINAADELKRYKTKRTSDYVARSQALTDLQEALGMTEAPLRIECYDISHLGGTGVVASMVVFEDGLAKKRDYRSFNIAHTRDDTDSMYQVLMRRLRHLDDDGPGDAASSGEERHASSGTESPGTPPGDEDAAEAPAKRHFAYRPQLLLVDGGQPQVAAAAKALRDSGATGIALAGIAKRLEELWLPNDEFPVILPRDSEALYLVQRVRDEAHRFAITHQRKRRAKALSTQLVEIPGLGAARAQRLLQHFGSVKRLQEASVTEIGLVQGFGPTLSAEVHAFLHPDTDAPAARHADEVG